MCPKLIQIQIWIYTSGYLPERFTEHLVGTGYNKTTTTKKSGGFHFHENIKLVGQIITTFINPNVIHLQHSFIHSLFRDVTEHEHIIPNEQMQKGGAELFMVYYPWSASVAWSKHCLSEHQNKTLFLYKLKSTIIYRATAPYRSTQTAHYAQASISLMGLQ